jgi:hypothetical protein
LRETRKARFNGVTVDCPVYQRERLDVGVAFAGPAIVDQLDATTVIPPGVAARVDAYKNILILRDTPPPHPEEGAERPSRRIGSGAPQDEDSQVSLT